VRVVAAIFAQKYPGTTRCGGARGVLAPFRAVSLSVVNASSAPPPINRRLALAALGVGVFAPSVLAACSGKSITQAIKQPPPGPRVTFQPADAASDVVPIAPISVQVSDGWFQHVALTNSSGKVVAGAFNQDRTVYTGTESLGYDSTYTWSGSAVGHDGKAIPVKGKFTTLTPTKKIDGGFQLADGQTVGVAAPIIIQFDAPISDKAAVERALTVSTNPPVEGAGRPHPLSVSGVLPGGHHRQCRRQALRAAFRRRCVRRAGHVLENSDRSSAGGEGRGLFAPHPGVEG
jgi:hypothetical protein